MLQTIQQIGSQKSLILTEDMLRHIGPGDTVDVVVEEGRIVITASRGISLDPPGVRVEFVEAKSQTFARYDEALRKLAE